MALAIAASGWLFFAGSSVRAQSTPPTPGHPAPIALSTICHFYNGPRSGTNIDFASRGLRPQPVGSPCHDGAGSAGVVIARRTAIAPDYYRRAPSYAPPAAADGYHPSGLPHPPSTVGAAPRAADGAPRNSVTGSYHSYSYSVPGGGSPGPAPARPVPPPPAVAAKPYSSPVPTGVAAAPSSPPAYPALPPATASVPPPPPRASGVAFGGGAVRKAIVTPTTPLPQRGFGLYVYILPELDVDPAILQRIEEYHHCRLDAVGTGEASETIALMILPIRNIDTPRVDTALSHDLVRTVVADELIDAREVYLIATNSPLIRGTRIDPRFATVITLGRIAPDYVGSWLARLQSFIEQGRIESPASLALRIRSLLVEVNAIGSLIGITPANAAPYKCA